MGSNNYSVEDVHISLVSAGDTVIHNGKLMTISKPDLKRDPLMGVSLFGDSYNLGTKPVTKVTFLTAKIAS